MNINEDEENNVNSILDDLFLICHKTIVTKNKIISEPEEVNFKRCYIRYIKSLGIVGEMLQFLEKKNEPI